MSHELVYTSAPRGLKPGTQGFCTVICTEGMPAALMQRLEDLSAYRFKYALHDPNVANNPILYSHLRIASGGKTLSVLSRVGPAGRDYTQRPNICAHHVVLEPGECPPGGPAWLLRRDGFMETAWDGTTVRTLPDGRRPTPGDRAPAICNTWKSLAGDAGWAGVLVETFLNDPRRTVYLVYEPGTDPLPLIEEALALLPPAQRWAVTFNTYFMGQSQGVTCAWRCVLRGSPEAESARRLPGSQVLILELGKDNGRVEEGALVEQARTGRAPAPRPQAAFTPDPIPDPTPGLAPDDDLDSFLDRAPSIREFPGARAGGYDQAPESPPRPPRPLKSGPPRPAASQSFQLRDWVPHLVFAALACIALSIAIAAQFLRKAGPTKVAAAPAPSLASVENKPATEPDSTSADPPEPVTPPSSPPAGPKPPSNDKRTVQTVDIVPPTRSADTATPSGDGGKPGKEIKKLDPSDPKPPEADKPIEYITIDSLKKPGPGKDLSKILKKNEPIKLTIEGIADDPIAKSGLAIDPNGPESAKLTLYWRNPTSFELSQVAVFQVVDRKLSVDWKELANPAELAAQKLIRECVLVIKQDGSPTIQLALSRYQERPNFPVPATPVALFKDIKDSNWAEPVHDTFIDPATARLRIGDKSYSVSMPETSSNSDSGMVVFMIDAWKITISIKKEADPPPQNQARNGNTSNPENGPVTKCFRLAVVAKDTETPEEKNKKKLFGKSAGSITYDEIFKGKLRADVYMKVGGEKVLVAKLGKD